MKNASPFHRFSRILAGVILLATSCGWGAATPVADATRLGGTQSFARLPLCFEQNSGQAGSEVRYLARGRGYTFCIAPWGARLFFTRSEGGALKPVLPVTRSGSAVTTTRAVEMQFVGAQPAPVVEGLNSLPGKVNYFLGGDSAEWRLGVPLVQRVRLRDVYPGVNVEFYGASQHLEYDWVLEPHANPAQIVIRFAGVDRIEIDSDGELVLHVGHDEIRQHCPVLHQSIHGERHEVSGGYRLLAANQVGFTVGDYDPGLPLVIDPVLDYATYLGGTGLDAAWQIAVDASGAAYIAGETTSEALTASTGAFQTNYGGGTLSGGDIFVAKLSPEGTNLDYLTYIGGKGDDGALALALDASGNVYLTGYTDSTNFPTVNPLNPTIAGAVDTSVGFPPSDAFVAKLSADGSRLEYSTYVGGDSFDQGLGVAVDSDGNAYVSGFTDSTNFPTLSPIQAVNRGGRDGFLFALNPAGSEYLFSTYLGGTNTDLAVGVALDPSRAVYVAGYTSSTNFPITNAIQTLLNLSTNDYGDSDAFVTKLAPGGTQMVYSTFLGGLYSDFAYHVVADSAGNAYVAGWGDSYYFPLPDTNVTSLFLVQTNTDPSSYVSMDTFVVKLDPAGTLLRQARFGGTGDDQAVSLQLDRAGNIWAAGFTTSPLIPIAGGSSSLYATNNGLNDAFVFALSPDFSALRYSVVFGGTADDYAFGLDVDAAGNAYLAGKTASSDFPVLNGLQPAFAGGTSDAFIARVLWEPQLTLQLAGTNVIVNWPAPAPGFRLQTRAVLDMGDWQDAGAAPMLDGDTYSVTLPVTNAPAFFRLYRP